MRSYLDTFVVLSLCFNLYLLSNFSLWQFNTFIYLKLQLKDGTFIELFRLNSSLESQKVFYNVI